MKTITKKSKLPELKGVEFGKNISEEMSHYLKKYVGSVDRALISNNTGVGIEQINKLIQGSYYSGVTKKNYPALVEAVNMAISKSEDEARDANVCNKKLQSFLGTE